MNQISKRLEKAVAAARAWPLDRQEAAAEVLEQMDRLAVTPYKLSIEERADLEEALAEGETWGVCQRRRGGGDVRTARPVNPSHHLD